MNFTIPPGAYPKKLSTLVCWWCGNTDGVKGYPPGVPLCHGCFWNDPARQASESAMARLREREAAYPPSIVEDIKRAWAFFRRKCKRDGYA